MRSKPRTPDLDRYVKLAKEHGTILTEFLDWLNSQYVICEWLKEEDGGPTDGGFVQVIKYGESLLCEFFEIDQEKVSEQRDAVLRHIQELN